MTATTEYEKKSITMPRETVRGVQERVGSRQFSAYVAEATAERLRRDALAESIVRREAVQGPTVADDTDEILQWLAE
ncbi:MAG: CopG family transcriptional regulator [Micrococcales bacterium]|nr:CopG family transcriptional regulator [Micrococcales bacterium]MCL2666681.1 CopG family transcriptional regulator [Micrococcales bacterium]